jgi:alpha-D-xyloside xylohydrolase
MNSILRNIRHSTLVRLISLIAFLSVSTACSANRNRTTVSYIKADDDTSSLEFSGGGLKEALELHLTGDAALFFEENGKRHELRGAPQNQQATEAAYRAQWVVEETEVTLEIERIEEGLRVALAAAGAEPTRWGITLDLNSDEYITGLMERVVNGVQDNSWREGITEAMNLNGQVVDMIIEPTLSIYTPFHISSRGYGLLVEGTWPGHYDIGASNPEQLAISFEGPTMEFQLTFADSMLELVEQHTLRVGPPVKLPKWALGHWRWRDDHAISDAYYNGSSAEAPYNADLVEDILMMQYFDIPSSVYWIDRPWAACEGEINEWKLERGFCDYTWNPERFPNAVEMIDWLGSKDINLLLWIAPFVAGDMERVAKERGWNLPFREDAGARGATKRFLAMMDFTNPEAVRWWQETGPAKVLRDGVKGFKLDRADRFVPRKEDLIVHDGRSARENNNDYPRQYVKATYEIAREIHGDDFVLLPRAAYTGSSKYAAFWGGDTGPGPWGLRSAIIAQLRASVMGFPYWGSDVGGYWGKDLHRRDHARWLAFGCFSVIMEVGPTYNRGYWSMPEWFHPERSRYDAELIAIWRFYAQLRHRLIDYSYEHVQVARNTGTPVARPLFLIYPDQPEAWSDWGTYLYGPDILVSPVWQREATEHSLYLPEGEIWIDAWNPEQEFAGGQTITVSTPLHKLPLFLRKGSELNLGDLNVLYAESVEKTRTEPDIKELELAEFGE